MTFKEHMKKKYTLEDLKDMAHYGCDGGFDGLIYTSDCVKLYAKYKEDIYQINRDYDVSYDLLLEESYTCDQLETKLVWCAAEICAGQLTEEV